MVLDIWESLCYSKEWVWNLRKKLCCIASEMRSSASRMWSRVSLQELHIRYIIIYIFYRRYVKVAERFKNHFTFLINEVRSPARENIFWLFNSDILNLLLNINRGRKKIPNFVTFVVWHTLIVGGLVLVGVLVAWSKKYCLGPAEIPSFVPLILFKNAGRKVSPRFHLFCFWC